MTSHKCLLCEAAIEQEQTSSDDSSVRNDVILISCSSMDLEVMMYISAEWLDPRAWL